VIKSCLALLTLTGCALRSRINLLLTRQLVSRPQCSGRTVRPHCMHAVRPVVTDAARTVCPCVSVTLSVGHCHVSYKTDVKYGKYSVRGRYSLP